MRKGFTLLELIIVVIILGILISIAIPQFIGTRLRAYSAEAFNILGVMRSAQIRYYEQFNTYTASCANLDVGLTSLQYHVSPPTCASATGTVSAQLRTTLGNYTLSINPSGAISCIGTDCGRLGY